MTPFPVPLFPASGAAAKPAGFVAAVLIGLALYLAAQNANARNQQPR